MKICFVIMPYGEPWDAYFRDIFSPAVQKTGLTPVRADSIREPGSMPDQIRDIIRKADVVLADISDNNPNVMYELGVADTEKKPVVVLKQFVSKTPSDLKGRRYIPYETNRPKWDQRLLKDITGALVALGKLPRRPGSRKTKKSDRGISVYEEFNDAQARELETLASLPQFSAPAARRTLAMLRRFLKHKKDGETIHILVSWGQIKVQTRAKAVS